ncbi:hypothetical protein PU634_04910 [Oceanimonas pelagia]|uniref:Uncharacterized protein n=1 Tax=Oceanimonas pelagia TaxID=3028314 RepID=A0AA50QCX2_9GAMM|nr:hypothetical protein [Oceanimonas pelagia]WMC11707.1 hypothetical protein PU634_04910 [Oceanimonas pelagia]
MQPKKPTRGAKVERPCATCSKPMQVRAADVKRGWGRFCSKSCKAKHKSNECQEAPMFNPPRPTLTPDMIKAAAEKLVSQPYFPLDEIGVSKDEAIEHLTCCYRHHMDSYELAKSLDDNHGWHVNSVLVDDLGCMGAFVSGALKEAERAWLAEHNIQPPLPVGTELNIGVITDVACHHSPGCYLVKLHDDGPDEQTGHRRSIVRFEDAKLKEQATC